MRFFLLSTLFLVSISSFAQNVIRGKIVSDSTGLPLEGAQVSAIGSRIGSSTNADGNFTLILPADKEVTLSFSYIGFKSQTKRIDPNQSPGFLFIRLRYTIRDHQGVDINGNGNRQNGINTIDPKIGKLNPMLTGIRDILGAFIQTNNELSASYNVRGGNYDENLVYVNGIEVQRPQLARSGQQEGMSFINPDLVGRINFSNGGFESKYGDKLSSVLDITYRKPDSLRYGFSAGFMGGSAFFEDRSKNNKFSIIAGARYRTLSGLLSTLDVQGDYHPRYGDFQANLNYKLSKNWELSSLHTYAANVYSLVPQSRETSFGTIKEALLLRVYFAGQEYTNYGNSLQSLNAAYTSNSGKTRLRFGSSYYHALEKEIFDVEGAYFLDQLDNDPGSKDFGKVRYNRGYGGFQTYGRNQLEVKSTAVQHSGTYQNAANKPIFEWGIKMRQDQFKDQLYEWKRVDSAGFSLPLTTDSTVHLEEFIFAKNNITAYRAESFGQMRWDIDRLGNQFTMITGIRANYHSITHQTLISPRLILSFRPDWRKDWLFRLSGGHYTQPPFYRDMRTLNGSINLNIKAQQSWQVVLAGDRNFQAWGRNFKFVTEAWYKYLYDLIPYEIDNVRLRYYGTNNAVGFAKGLDFRVNGEFVPGLESWMRLSFMSTKEDILDDYYLDANGNKVFPGYIRRPSDQRMNLSILFQDYLPNNPTYTVHLNLFYGTRLPVGPPDYIRYKDTFSMPAYRRVDIGFSKQLIGGAAKPIKNSGFLQGFEGLWLSLDVFNLLQIQNTVSYTWIRDNNSAQYAVPNYLTNRQINLKLTGTLGRSRKK